MNLVSLASKETSDHPSTARIAYDFATALGQREDELKEVIEDWNDTTKTALSAIFAFLAPEPDCNVSPLKSADSERLGSAIETFANAMFKANDKLDKSQDNAAFAQGYGMILSDVSKSMLDWHESQTGSVRDDIPTRLFILHRLAQNHGSTGFLPSTEAMRFTKETARRGPWAILSHVVNSVQLTRDTVRQVDKVRCAA